LIIKFVPGFESIVDQARPVRLLANIIEKGNIPHALLFTGIAGVGKREAAIAFAMACNCTSANDSRKIRAGNGDHRRQKSESDRLSCGSCRTCKKIVSGNHPDVITIQPQDARIRISQIRDLCHTLALKPYKARYRIVVIIDAHSMNQEAGNSLLKVLEEPPERTILILTAPHSYDLLPTIVSRCQHIRFNPISQKTLTAKLVQDHAIPLQKAELLSTLANGSLTEVHTLVENLWMEQRNIILKAVGVDTITNSALQNMESMLILSEKLARRKEKIIETLEILKLWYRDLMVYKYSPEKIINKDLIHHIKEIAQHLDISSILSKYEAIQSAQQHIDGNANPRLTLDVLMLEIVTP
jgi:DNA polymerase-3 subunit delta'